MEELYMLERQLEIGLRVGSGSVHTIQKIVAFLKAALQREKLMGSANLKTLLQRGAQLEIVGVPAERMKGFTKLAKQHGLLFSAVEDKTKMVAADKSAATITGKDKGGNDIPVGKQGAETPADKGLVIEEIADKEVAAPGETITWTYKVSNTGMVDARNVTVTDKTMAGVGPFDENGTYAIGNLAAGKSGEFTVKIKNEPMTTVMFRRSDVAQFNEVMRKLGVVDKDMARTEFDVSHAKESFHSRMDRAKETARKMAVEAKEKVQQRQQTKGRAR